MPRWSVSGKLILEISFPSALLLCVYVCVHAHTHTHTSTHALIFSELVFLFVFKRTHDLLGNHK